MKKYILFLVVFVFGLFISNASFVKADYPDGCSTVSAYSTTTGQPCGGNAASVVCPAGDVFSSVTGQRCTTYNETGGTAGDTDSVVKFKELFKTNFKVGVKSEDVRVLQQFLKDEGYYFGKLDGKYGKISARAAKDFQDDYNLSAPERANPAGNMMPNPMNRDNLSSGYNPSMPGTQSTPLMPPRGMPTPPPFRSGCTSTDGSSSISGEPCNWNTSVKSVATSSQCTLKAPVVTTKLTDNGTSWGFYVKVDAINPSSASHGWTTNFEGYTPTATAYGTAQYYGDFFLSSGPLQFNARDQVDGNCTTMITVSPPSAPTPSITLLSPNGGERFIQTSAGQTTVNSIKWSGSGVFQDVQVALMRSDATIQDTSTNKLIGWIWAGTPTNTNETSWDAKTVCADYTLSTPSGCFQISPGIYKIFIYGYLSNIVQVKDISDQPFSVINTTSPASIYSQPGSVITGFQSMYYPQGCSSSKGYSVITGKPCDIY